MNKKDEMSRDPIRELERSEPRPRMPEDSFQQVKAAARKQWLEVVRQESESSAGIEGIEGVPEKVSLNGEPLPSSRPLPLVALAAALLLSVTVVLWLRTQDAAEIPVPTLTAVATLERAQGVGQIQDSAEDLAEPAVEGLEVQAGSIVTTEESSMLALRLATGASLRLAPGTRVRVVDGRQVEIDFGRLYFDSARARNSEQDRALLEIRAGGAVIRDLGTQFEVRRDSEYVQLRVREGIGQLRVGSRQANAGAREQLTVAGRDSQQASELLIERGAFESTIETWRWILDIAPSFSLDGATLKQYLEWVARETGWQVDTTSPGVAQLLEKQTCCIETRLPPDQPEEVLSTLGLTSRVEGNVLVVFVP